MLLVTLSLSLIGAIAGLIKGGSLANLAATSARAPILLIAGLVLEIAYNFIAAPSASSALNVTVFTIANLLVMSFLLLNRSLPGAWVIAAGLGLNMLVIILNGAMPVDPEASRIAGYDPSDESGVLWRNIGPETRLPWLGDVIPLPNLRSVISIGDVLIAAGLGWLTYRQTLEPVDTSRQRRSEDTTTSPAARSTSTGTSTRR